MAQERLPQTPGDLRDIADRLVESAEKLRKLAERMDRRGIKSIRVLNSIGARTAARVTVPAYTVDCEKRADEAGA